jgi:penicillin amidase
VPLRSRRERIARRGHAPWDLVVHETEHGVLEGDPARADGDYLCWAWSGSGDAGVGTLSALFRLPRCRGAAEARKVASVVDIPSLHMLFADRAGNIGYQLVGRIPRRRAGWSGLAPAPGWQRENDWQGWLDPGADLPWEANPARGFIASANEARACLDGSVAATLPQPPYRLQRIERLLADGAALSVEHMQQMQYDVYSLQAERLLPVLLPYSPRGPERALLESWDLRYTPQFKAATLFENMRESAVVATLGAAVGGDWVREVLQDTILPFVLVGPLDDLLCRGPSSWLPAARRDDILGEAVRECLKAPDLPWGKRQTLRLPNSFVPGLIGRLLGFEHGPFPLPGSRATLRLGSRGRYFGRELISGASYRFIADLGSERLEQFSRRRQRVSVVAVVRCGPGALAERGVQAAVSPVLGCEGRAQPQPEEP